MRIGAIIHPTPHAALARDLAEYATRIALQALSGNRLRLGVGSGSTKADFDLIGADFEQRFKRGDG